jgi:hypothetical protein
VFSSAPGMFSEHIDRLRAVAERWRSWGAQWLSLSQLERLL